MKLSAPKKSTFWLSLIIGIVGIVSYFISIPLLSLYYFWLLAVAFVLLVLSVVLKGL